MCTCVQDCLKGVLQELFDQAGVQVRHKGCCQGCPCLLTDFPAATFDTKPGPKSLLVHSQMDGAHECF